MELLIIAVCVIAAACMLVYSLWPNRGDQVDAVLRRAAGHTADSNGPIDVRKAARGAARFSILEKAAPMLSKPLIPKNDADQSALKIKLSNAGFRQESVVMVFLSCKIIAGVALGLLGLLFAVNAGKPPMTTFGLTAFFAGIGFIGPELWLYVSRGQRMEAIRNGLPDSLDLMVVSVEAGLGLDAALMRVGDEMRNVHPELSEELQIATIETQMGIHRGQALEKMATRTGVEEMKSLVAVVVQAEKLGTSIAKALRTQADSLRTKRRQRAEERAQKTAVKLMLPLILFIFPAILIVLGVPAGIKLTQTLSGNGPLAGS